MKDPALEAIVAELVALAKADDGALDDAVMTWNHGSSKVNFQGCEAQIRFLLGAGAKAEWIRGLLGQ